ncbi:MAG: hypothetical protein AABZ17_08655, partial [Nitrospirota bacterium]
SFPSRSLGNRSHSTDARSDFRQLTGSESDPGGAIRLLQDAAWPWANTWPIARLVVPSVAGCEKTTLAR